MPKTGTVCEVDDAFYPEEGQLESQESKYSTEDRKMLDALRYFGKDVEIGRLGRL